MRGVKLQRPRVRCLHWYQYKWSVALRMGPGLGRFLCPEPANDNAWYSMMLRRQMLSWFGANYVAILELVKCEPEPAALELEGGD
jgi:hypothetical protein